MSKINNTSLENHCLILKRTHPKTNGKIGEVKYYADVLNYSYLKVVGAYGKQITNIARKHEAQEQISTQKELEQQT